MGRDRKDKHSAEMGNPCRKRPGSSPGDPVDFRKSAKIYVTGVSGSQLLADFLKLSNINSGFDRKRPRNSTPSSGTRRLRSAMLNSRQCCSLVSVSTGIFDWICEKTAIFGGSYYLEAVVVCAVVGTAVEDWRRSGAKRGPLRLGAHKGSYQLISVVVVWETWSSTEFSSCQPDNKLVIIAGPYITQVICICKWDICMWKVHRSTPSRHAIQDLSGMESEYPGMDLSWAESADEKLATLASNDFSNYPYFKLLLEFARQSITPPPAARPPFLRHISRVRCIVKRRINARWKGRRSEPQELIRAHTRHRRMQMRFHGYKLQDINCDLHSPRANISFRKIKTLSDDYSARPLCADNNLPPHDPGAAKERQTAKIKKCNEDEVESFSTDQFSNTTRGTTKLDGNNTKWYRQETPKALPEQNK
ncbi:hypothetical protein GEV33_006003 [Tenebrio molitor]|uniref:Uncharacterized protein n=1 Tax=Tenebrio molitor TaxID=7067 RepID=A0A8J6LEU7_TENMO|nr:hypothetical protein GEV33_006003 [Tenebrio molitor]